MNQDKLQRGYEEMAHDTKREAEALEWREALIDEPSFDDDDESWQH